ncbi:hypothetical protein CORT_0G00760 [Candida orthopsilosis Co 90-125]|uniref:Uncharacterized protein n=1 Tax=Candida orthopsilosis (strain 90-125) TaxID=1136231 RepID=H8X9U8_CANO9|nr:hypothetical protein CORT_0G00760 [Candida orthopsilosis Co 90-125]CCG24765.1 hypothetical protein CORT_0G00760 [Candida orthopsilosis Co 90-125]
MLMAGYSESQYYQHQSVKSIRKLPYERGRTPSRDVQFDQHLQTLKGESRSRHSRQELLHQAVNHRSSLTRSLTQAPHERQKEQCYTHRPEFKRWNSYDLPPNGGPSKEISPFTILDDQYNTKHPVANSINLSTDNSFKELERSTPQQTPPKTNLYEKMTNFAQGLASFYTKISPSSDENLSGRIEKEANDTQYEIESVEGEDIEPGFEEIISKLALQSSDTNKPKLNRTQQKQLDLKDLYQKEHTDLPELNYDWKIQNETISSQYTTIRLRFSSRQISSKQIENDMGVLGFIKRYSNGEHTTDPATPGEKDPLLRQIWEDANSVLSV